MANPVDVDYYLGRSSKFTDPDFTHDTDALYWVGHNEYSSPYYYRSSTTWKRISDFKKSSHSMFGNEGVTWTHDIEQGSLGNCYYMSAASAMAEFSERFTSLFYPASLNSKGIYGFNVFVKGVPVRLVVDDYLPGRASGSNFYLHFANHGETGALWMPLLEKLWAKVNGNYAQIEGGYIPEALDFLTGLPSASYDNADLSVNQIWNVVKDAD